MSRIGVIALALWVALAALAAGLWLGGHPKDLPGPIRDAFVADDRALRAEVVDEIEDSFYKKVDRKKIEERSLKGMVDALGDPFSHYLTPSEAERLNESVSGKFEGVGMTVEEDRRGLRVLTVFGGSPARRAGIRKGDLITAVNGKSIAGLSDKVATARIRGEAGTQVRLRVQSAANRTRRTLRVKRERIEIPVARGRIVTRGGERLGVVQLFAFSEGAHGLLRQQIDRLRREGAKGILLDLRGNGGGLLREAILVSSVFLEDGRIVSIKGRTRPERVENAEGDAIDETIPVVVLVDRGSASASEIVAGALRDRRRATLVGTRTFGKGLVQDVRPLSNGGVLDITVATYYLPKGGTIAVRKGIRPQVEARDDPKTRRDEAVPVALDELLDRTR
jgi:carboxyl-terminal processing protease